MNLTGLIDSLKGISGSGNIFSQSVKFCENFIRTLEPGDFVRSGSSPLVLTTPIGYDLWYLWSHANFMYRYFVGINGNTYDYSLYISQNLGFLNLLTGLKPLKTVKMLSQLLSHTPQNAYALATETIWKNEGIYWVNLLAFELRPYGKNFQSLSNGSIGYQADPTKYMGYLSWPIGQLGVMEVISLIRETEDLSGYPFAAITDGDEYWLKPPIVYGDLENKDKVSVQVNPMIFPETGDSGKNYCYGRHLLESGYIKPTTSQPSRFQNILNSGLGPARLFNANQDVEMYSFKVAQYSEDIEPKKWMRYWIHRDDQFPVPGEFVGILCRPAASPPHIWWFQESAPFVYAGNWIETHNLTSGLVTAIILHEDRTDGGIGNQYTVKIQGCEVLIESSDFYQYSVGDRVAILKLNTINSSPTTSFIFNNQPIIQETDKLTIMSNYLILPATFYKSRV